MTRSKSSSFSSGDDNCVQVWRKSSCSGETNCVQVTAVGDHVLVAHTRDLLHLVAFTRPEWHAFIEGVKAGEFDV